MLIFDNIHALKEHLSHQKDIGFVPTMGALHAGHRSLVEKSKEEGRYTVCSIYVNPTQFNDKKDLEKYPITLDADTEILKEAGCDVLFLPTSDEIYPNGFDSVRKFEFGNLEHVLEGAKRPGHFVGVGQVMSRLLEIVQPRYLYMGQKDFQQCLIVKHLINQLNMQERVNFVMCPTVREDDGLAMSSRNVRLTEQRRQVASSIYQCLTAIRSQLEGTAFNDMEKRCTKQLWLSGFQPEYVAVVRADTLEPIHENDDGIPTVALIAAKLGDVRLIDNLLL